MNDAQPEVVLDPTREPIVVVDGLHIVYRVYGGGGNKGSAATALMRVVRREGRPQMKEVHAVKGVSFVAYRGDAIGVIGTNGSGKSTLLKAIAGLLPPARGGVYTDGQPSLLGVNAALMKDLSGSRNITLGCLAMGLNMEETRARYEEIVKFADLKPGFIEYPMSTYSSGMGARLRFAIAAARTHDVMLIDEALATGDAKFKRRSKAKIDELRKDAGAVFLVAHNLDVIEETCNRVIWLDEGRIHMDGDPDEVIAAYTEASGK
ncbi:MULTISPECIES: ABC transporter ATP-binding protein [Thermomonosporaceae]|uniref:ABC transporter ATP-binding protein n=1 Tax=Thermomonosporaceae TaxID=2012 RepID=UPI00255AC06E|nr:MULTISPECIES: ABC transporter ATP-binding protein [Thermomonosporaceae]MDL4772648.1 ABC transporter ATP-binding protein [Actinomadura xylanilytica]